MNSGTDWCAIQLLSFPPPSPSLSAELSSIIEGLDGGYQKSLIIKILAI